MKNLFLIIFTFVIALAVNAKTSNLLNGDADVELESNTMTKGPYSNSKPDKPKWALDKTTGFNSSSSIKLLEFCGMGVKGVVLPKGIYTFSFYAKGENGNTMAHITVNGRHDGFPLVLKKRAKGTIYLTKDWKRYSHTFKADGKTEYSGYYGIGTSDVAWFDRFMLNEGDKPIDWVQAMDYAGSIAFNGIKGHVFKIDSNVEMTFNLAKFAEENIEKTVDFELVNYLGKVLKKEQLKPKFDKNGNYQYKYIHKGNKSGWFKITIKMDGMPDVISSFIVVRKPEPTIKEVEPFVGLILGEYYLEAMKLIGVKWLQTNVAWYWIEAAKGRYQYDSIEKFEQYKKQGFKILGLFQPTTAPWVLPKNILNDAGKFNINYPRLLPREEDLPLYKAMVQDMLKKYPNLFDIYELGGELDALIGLNTYYKSFPNQKMLGPFVLGNSFDILLKQMKIVETEIRKKHPQATISAVRPSDVDARYKYLYSKEFFKNFGKGINAFGIDCYPQPRWIGSTQPPVGSEQDLATRYNDAKEVLKKYGSGDNIYIAEYGYFIDINEIHNPKYLNIQVNRLARSYLKARLLNMTSLHWYDAENDVLEGNKFYMGNWYNGNPLPSMAAMSAVAKVVDNVKLCKEFNFHDNMGVGAFQKYDGRAVAAFWSRSEKYAPTLEIDANNFIITDVMGNPIEVEKKSNKIRFVISELPCYIWSKEKNKDNYSTIISAIENMKIEEEIPVDIAFRPENKHELKLYFTNGSNKSYTGKINYSLEDGKTQSKKFTVNPKISTKVILPLPKVGKKIKMNIVFDGGFKPYITEYQTPEILKVKYVENIKLDGNFTSWENSKIGHISGKGNIHPVDHTTYNGNDDLSCDYYLAHDNKYLYFGADVTDNKHFQNFTGNMIWKGDCIQIGIDPKTNFVRDENDIDFDDSIMSLALTKEKAEFVMHRGPSIKKLTKNSKVFIKRDEDNKKTVYQIKLPLEGIDTKLKTNAIFGFNFIIMDDDTNTVADYWLFLRQGLAGGLRPDKFALCIIE